MNMLEELAEAYGVSEESTRSHSKPRITKRERAFINKLKKKYAQELFAAKEMRRDLLNMIRGANKQDVITHLDEAKEMAPLLVLLFNDEQLVLLWAMRDKLLVEREENDTTEESK